jgi:TonB family protein
MLILSFDCTNKTISQNPTSSSHHEPKFVKGGLKVGYRSRPSAMRGIMAIIVKLRNVYNEEYKVKSQSNFIKVVTIFKISYLGNVTSSKISESNSNNPDFDSKVLDILNSFQFEPIDQIGDTTVITYPFLFGK